MLIVLRFHEYGRINFSGTLHSSAILIINILWSLLYFSFTVVVSYNVELVSGYGCGKVKEKTFPKNLSEIKREILKVKFLWSLEDSLILKSP